MDQQQENLLIHNVRRGVEICLLSWPTLRHALQSSWISENKNLKNSPRIASFKKMTNYQLTDALIDELELYILKHQVEPEHLEQWFQNLMDQVFCADCQQSFIPVMAKQLVDLVKDLQDGNMNKMKEFQDAYQKMKNGKFSISRVQGNDSSSQGSESGDSQGEMDQQLADQQQAPKLVEEIKKSEEEKALEDDGWTIVKKKK